MIDIWSLIKLREKWLNLEEKMFGTIQAQTLLGNCAKYSMFYTMFHTFLYFVLCVLVLYSIHAYIVFYKGNENSDLNFFLNIQLLAISSSLVLLGFMVHHYNGLQIIYGIKNDILRCLWNKESHFFLWWKYGINELFQQRCVFKQIMHIWMVFIGIWTKMYVDTLYKMDVDTITSTNLYYCFYNWINLFFCWYM